MVRPWRRTRARPPVTRPAGPDAPPPDPLDVGWATAAGHHGENQDRVRTGAGWLVVCDGVGGEVGGSRAATLAVDSAAQVLARGAGTSVRQAVRAAHAAVRAGQAAEADRAHMAATVTAARAEAVQAAGSRWVVAHLGDSPAWHLGPAGSEQLTADHTVAGALLASGAIDPDEAAHHPGRRFVTQVAGGRDGIDPGVVEVRLAPGEHLVVATDGVSDVLRAETLAAIVRAADDTSTAAASLVDAARAAGTTDDATVVVVRHRPAGGG